MGVDHIGGLPGTARIIWDLSFHQKFIRHAYRVYYHTFKKDRLVYMGLYSQPGNHPGAGGYFPVRS